IRAFFKMQWEAIFCHRPDYGRLQVSAQLHSEIAPPTDMPRLPKARTSKAIGRDRNALNLW
ncbi:hypothetical protein ACTOV4_23155, partial [Brucella sp. C7-11G]